MRPRVSFLVPCYKLAHYLPDCVHSILAQTFQDFEIVILDDCSPDNTPEVAASFTDPRVRYIRRDPNLGHLRNGNQGVADARADLIWLISADDRIRRPYALERYVALLDRQPGVGYVFSPAMKLKDGVETVICGANGASDAVLAGHTLLIDRLLQGNTVCASAVLARRACYDKVGLMPLDLPFAADWYMWAMFAMHFDVGYLAEPLLNYRIHGGNMTNEFVTTRQRALVMNDLLAGWRFKQEAERVGNQRLIQAARDAFADRMAYHARLGAEGTSGMGLSIDDVTAFLSEAQASPTDARTVKSTTFAVLGDHFFEAGDPAAARRCYAAALEENRGDVRTTIKYWLLFFGGAGRLVRRATITTRAAIQPAVLSTRNGVDSA